MTAVMTMLASKHNSALLSCQAENCTKTEGVFCPFNNGWDALFCVCIPC